MQNPAVSRKLFSIPISVADIHNWYLDFSGDGKFDIMGPPVTEGINAFTGPSVRHMALPEWTSARDLHHLTTHCPNLETVDFLEIFRSIHGQRAWLVGYDIGGDDDQEEESIDFSSPLLDRCPALFRNLRSVHFPYGCWKAVDPCRQSRYQFNRITTLPDNLSLAEHLQSLAISCQPMSTRYTSPATRRMHSLTLLTEILRNVNGELRTLGLYESVSTIDNLDRFMQSLAAVFPKLRTLKLSLYQDLFLYQRELHYVHNLGPIIRPILSCRTKDYQHDTASVLQYLSVVKKIKDRGRFTVVPTDKDCGWRYLPREFYGLDQKHLMHGPGDNHWSPVWLWNDRLPWIKHHERYPGVEVVDIRKCRAIFEELTKANVCVSLDLAPQLIHGTGALFATTWVKEIKYRRYDEQGKAHDGSICYPPKAMRVKAASCDPGQHFIRRDSTRVVATSSATYRYSFLDQLPIDYEQLEDELRGTLLLHPTTMPPSNTSAPRNEQPQSNPEAFYASDPKPDLPNPVWRLHEIGDLVDDLRIILNSLFAYEYTLEFTKNPNLKPDSEYWSEAMHHCQVHMRDRLWRESEYLALLFRRIPVDFPRLTRLALYIPAALYPDHDQTFIERVLPGTGWTVHQGHERVAGDDNSSITYDKACLRLANEICPFVRRIFTRAVPTFEPDRVVVHGGERYVTRRPRWDLDGEYKSMEELLTEPLRENYVIN